MAKENLVVLFPFMAQGHLLPFLALANLIQSRNPNLAVSIVNTPGNVERLRSILPPDSPIRFHALPFSPTDHGLPSGAENADSIPASDLLLLFLASPSLRPHFHRLLADLTELHGRPPSCIIGDYFLGWTVEVASNLGISHATFTTSGAYGTSCYMSMWLHLPHAGTSSPEFHVPGFPKSFLLHLSQLPPPLRTATATDPKAVFMKKQLPLSLLKTDAILCNTAEELEVYGLQQLRNLTGVQVWPVGPLHSGSFLKRKTVAADADLYLRWLDMHQKGSVIYISFGSMNTISAPQTMALAAGLEASGAPFVWVVQPPFGHHVAEDFKDEWLLEGFEARMTATRRGLLIKKWAPQFEILSHISIAAFLSHCGWNSTVESLSLGVPMIGWPLAADHFFISKLLEEELQVGLEVARGVEDVVKPEKIAAAIKLMVVDDKGKAMKAKAMELSVKIKAAFLEEDSKVSIKGSSLGSVDKFLETLIYKSQIV